MSPRWLRRLWSSRERSAASRVERPLLDGCPVVLKQLRAGPRGDALIEALGERYEVRLLDQEGMLHQVTVDDARFPDEAVVRLASVLDGIDHDWTENLAWPKAMSHSTVGDE